MEDWVRVEILRRDLLDRGLDVKMAPCVDAGSSPEECQYAETMLRHVEKSYHDRAREQFLMMQHDPMLRSKSQQTTKRVVNGLFTGEKITAVDGMVALATVIEAVAGRIFADENQANPLRGFGNQWAANAVDPAAREKIDAMVDQK